MKDIEPTRIKFKGKPTFDPTTVFDKETLLAYKNPEALTLPEPPTKLPRVRLRATRPNQIQLFKNLDDTDRLALFPLSAVADRPRSGGFSVTNNMEKDRFVLDARPPNACERTLKKWTYLMGALGPLLGFYLPYGCVLAIYADDLSDWYYEFIISAARAMRNVFQGEWHPMEFKDFKCFDPKLLSEKCCIPALKTMAMGDSNVVEFGMAGHITPAIRCKAIRPDTILRLRRRPPRGPYAAGVIQDDHLGLQTEVAGRLLSDGTHVPTEHPLADSMAEICFNNMRAEYRRLGMLVNIPKEKRRSFEHTAWGAHIFRDKGIVTAPRPRVVSPCVLTTIIAKLGYATIGILMHLAGSWSSVLLFRRRLLCLLDRVFGAMKGAAQDSIVRLSGELRSELLMCVALAPMAVTNLRAPGADRWYTVDVSNRGYAATMVKTKEHVTRELCRHTMQKGVWTRMLGKFQTWQYNNDLLEPKDILPGDEEFQHSKLFTELVPSQTFELVEYKTYKGRRPHINVGEVRSYLLAEHDLAVHQPSTRTPVVGDSRVAAGAIAKGRSASSALNQELQTGLGDVLGGDIYTGPDPLPTKLNPADDPTRDLPVRAAAEGEPDWFSELEKGRYGLLDDWLAAHPSQHDRAAPDFAEALPHSNVDEFSVCKPCKVSTSDEIEKPTKDPYVTKGSHKVSIPYEIEGIKL